MISSARRWQVIFLAVLIAFVTARWNLPDTYGLRVKYSSPEATPAGPSGISQVSTRDVSTAWNRRPPDVFTAQWSGYLIAPDAGTYTFSLTSDDGSMLRVDDILVIDNGGNHASETKAGQIELSRGAHAVAIDYSQAGGAYEIEWAWARDAAPPGPIPEWALSPYRIGYGTVLLIRWTQALFVPALICAGVIIVVIAFPR
jgi:hypothetical protein